MEQQPGPVNWARYNPAPLPGMVRLWSHEAFAHGAELVSYFRWRQYPKAQEQMHTGLLRPDGSDDIAVNEISQLARELAELSPEGRSPKSAALLFSYEADWITDIQPQGAGYSALVCAFQMYAALRRMGVDIDILSPEASFEGYRLLVLPCLPVITKELSARLASFGGQVVIGPRSGSKTEHFGIPDGLPPGPIRDLIPIRIIRTESLRPGIRMDGEGWSLVDWFEHVETDAVAEFTLNDGRPAVIKYGGRRYLAGWPDTDFMHTLLNRAATEAGIETVLLPIGLRIRRRGQYLWVFNYGQEPVEIPAAIMGKTVIGSRRLDPTGVTVLQTE